MTEICNAETERIDFILCGWEAAETEQQRLSQMSMLERWRLSMERLDWRIVRMESRRLVQAFGDSWGGQWQRRKGSELIILEDKERVGSQREKGAWSEWFLWFRFGEIDREDRKFRGAADLGWEEGDGELHFRSVECHCLWLSRWRCQLLWRKVGVRQPFSSSVAHDDYVSCENGWGHLGKEHQVRIGRWCRGSPGSARLLREGVGREANEENRR